MTLAALRWVLWSVCRLLGAGEYAQRRVPRWAQPVTAGGAAILYLSIYAAFGLYQLIRPDVAFLLLAVVVTVASLLALRYESIIIALLGVIGAFISPILLGPDLPDPRLMIVYILLVDLGILGISTFRNWRWFTLLGWVGSYGLFAYWLAYFPGFDPVLTHIVLTGVFLTFAAATPLFHILWRRMPGPADLSLMSVNATGYFALTFWILWDGYSEWFGLIAFSLSAFYGLIALLALRRSGTSARVAVFSLGIAVVFLTIAFPLQLSGYSVAIAWAAQGAMFVWMGFYLGRWQTRLVGLAVLSLAVAHLILFDIHVDIDGFTPVLNGRFLTAAIVVAAFYATGLIYWRNRVALGQLHREKFALPILLAVANLITLGLFSLEIVNYFDSRPVQTQVSYAEYALNRDNLTLLSLTLMLAFYGSILVSVGLARRLMMVRWAGSWSAGPGGSETAGIRCPERTPRPADLHARVEHSLHGFRNRARAAVHIHILVQAGGSQPYGAGVVHLPELTHSRQRGSAVDVESGSHSLFRQPGG